MKELEILLEEFWIIKETDKDSYYRIKDKSPDFKDFLEQKIGYKLIINPYMIKLEKLPGKPEEWMGIQDFDEMIEYSLLCLILVFLEDKSAGEQFVLSEITEFIEGSYKGKEKIDWTLFRHRKSLVKVLRFCVGLSIIKVDDGDEGKFMDSLETEVLYESTGLSRYFVRNFTGNILNYSKWQDIENGEWLDIDKDRGKVRRNRVYRRLIMSPAVYAQSYDDPDYMYIKNQHNLLQKDVEDLLDSQLHVHKNGAFVVLDSSKNFKDVFPSQKSISNIVLQVNTYITELIKKDELKRETDDTVIISKAYFETIIESIRESYLAGWSKEYREMTSLKLYSEVIGYMKSFGMIEFKDYQKELRIMPIIAKISGHYPKNFKTEEGN